jgi:hypothetical protein
LGSEREVARGALAPATPRASTRGPISAPQAGRRRLRPRSARRERDVRSPIPWVFLRALLLKTCVGAEYAHARAAKVWPLDWGPQARRCLRHAPATHHGLLLCRLQQREGQLRASGEESGDERVRISSCSSTRADRARRVGVVRRGDHAPSLPMRARNLDHESARRRVFWIARSVDRENRVRAIFALSPLVRNTHRVVALHLPSC